MIIKKLTRQGNSTALVIDKPLLELLEFDQDTQLKLTIKGRQLIVEPLSKEERDRRIKEVSQRGLKENAGSLRRLAK